MPEYILMKFGAYEHMESLVNLGEMYLNSFDFFRSAEGDDLRHDPHEGVSRIQQVKNGVLKSTAPEAGEKRVIGHITNGTIRESSSITEIMKLYCMFGVDITDHKRIGLKNMDRRVCSGFGDAVVIFKDPDALIDRVQNATKTQGIHVKFGPVRYVDSSQHNGDAGPFVKDHKYAYQNEVRFVAYGGDGKKPLTLNLGDLSDIALIMRAVDASKLSFEVYDRA